jgi:hypothetical protein
MVKDLNFQNRGEGSSPQTYNVNLGYLPSLPR